MAVPAGIVGDAYARHGRGPNRWLLAVAFMPYVAAIAGAAYLGMVANHTGEVAT
jgi:hypothetical protein